MTESSGQRIAAVLKTAVFTVVVPLSVTWWIPRAWMYLRRPFSWQTATGAFLVACGVAIYGWCAGAFAWLGIGTPAPIDPPKHFVATGLYRFVRNPMYVGVLAVLVGENLLGPSRNLLIYTAVVATLFHLFVLLYEEPALRRQFGASYDAYRASVPRWIPRPPRGPSGQV